MSVEGRTRSAGAFVGRERELDELLAGLEDALAGRGRLFLISGEPGIGKSRLADEVGSRARERGASVLVGRCWEAGGAPAYWPWVQALRAHLEKAGPEALRSQLGRATPELAQILPEVHEVFPDLRAPPPRDPESARFRLFEAVASFLRAAAQTRPIVLALDDLHAADAPSLLLLEFVAAQLTDVPILVLGAFRDVDPTLKDPLSSAVAELTRAPSARLLPLIGLGERDVASFIELSAGIEPRESLVSTIHRQTEGNPLFVGEVVRLLTAEGRLTEIGDESAWRLAVPEGVRAVIGRRLRRLSDECRRILTLASVLGREFDVGALAEVSSLPDDRVLEVLDEAAAERVVVQVPGATRRQRFAHALIRDTLYETLPERRRLQLHRHTGEALEAFYAADPEPHLAELAHHFSEAASEVDAARAIEYARRAAERAVALLAYEEAVRLYRLALASSALDAEMRCELMLALGDAQTRAGDEPAAKGTFLEAAAAARELGAAEQLARAALGYGGRFLWARAGTDAQIVPLLQEALAALGDEASVLRVKVLTRLSGALRDQHDREPRALLSAEAVDTARRLGDPATLAYALEGRWVAIFWPENTNERVAIGEELVELADELGDLERAYQAHYYRAMAQLELGDIPAVEAALERCERLTEELRQPAQRWLLAVTRATVAIFQGRFDEGERLMQEALALGGRAQRSDALLSHRIQEFTLRREGGGLEEIEETMRRSIVDYPARPMFRCMLAALYADLGRKDEARELFEELARDRFAALPLANEWLFSLGFLTDVAVFLGDTDRAAMLYELLLPYASRNASTADYVATGSVSRPLGILASALSRWDDAAQHFDDALEMNARMRARPWLARTQLEYAQMLVARDEASDRERALELARSSLETCQELGMRPWAEQARALNEQLSAPREADAAAEPTQTGPMVAGYRIEDAVGRGGMGVVYRAMDMRLERPVALKLVAPELAEDARFRERFLRESRLAASLDHPHVVPIYEAGEHDGQLFIAMRYVEGEDLKTLLARERRLEPAHALAILEGVAGALDSAHEQGLVHRDVKPANVLLDAREHAYLSDFGLTKQQGGASTQTSGIVGTFDYLAPEQIRGEAVDGRSDQYALACVLYEALAGSPPFRGESEAETLWAHMQEPPPPLDGHPQLTPVLERALAKDKDSRYRTCREFIGAAAAALGLEPPARRARRRRAGRRLLAAGALLVAGGIAALVVALTTGGSPPAAVTALPNSVAAIDVRTNRVVSNVPVGAAPSDVAVGEGRVWVLNADDRTISAIDLSTRQVVRTFAIESTPVALAVGAGAVWVTGGSDRLYRIDPGTATVERTITLPGLGNSPLFGLAVGRRAVWVASGRGTVGRVGLRSNALVALIRRLPGTGFPGLTRLAVDPSSVWVAADVGSLYQIDAATNRLVARIPRVGDGDVAVGEGSVWVTEEYGDAVWQVAPSVGAVSRAISVGARPVAVAVGAGSVWTANSVGGTVSRIDPHSGAVTSIPVGGTPRGLAVGDGLVWVAIG